MQRILICNDDGIHAPGIEVLEEAARELAEEVWVVAPDTERSGASHSLSLANPLRIRQIGERRFAVQGSPTDCVAIACGHLMKDALPTIILSGINRGANAGDDLTYSGTCAVAMEGTQMGIPAVALSQVFKRGEDVKWQTSRRYIIPVLKELLAHKIPPGVFFNVNFPAVEPDEVKGMRVTRQGKRDTNKIMVTDRIDARGFPYYWLSFKHESPNAAADTDLGATNSSYIAITPLHTDFTHHESRPNLENLATQFNQSQF